MKLFIDRERETKELEFSGTAAALLKQLNINTETVVVTKNGTIITEDIKVGGDDEVKIISVVSGG